MPHRPIRFERAREFPLAPAEAWRLLADTDALNRAVGLPAVEFSAMPGAEAGFVRRARARALGPLAIGWREYPFEWVRERRYSVRREFPQGPVRVIESGVELEPAAGGVRVRVTAAFEPRTLGGYAVAHALARRAIGRILRLCDERLRSGGAGGAPLRWATRLAAVNRERLEVRVGRLVAEGADPSLARRLGEHVAAAPERELARLRPYPLADAWERPRREVLTLLLRATCVGLFELRWELMCPICRVPKDEAVSLAELPGRFHCDTCGIDYETELDRRVELCFAVHPAVRRAEDAVYCIGSPMRMPHVVAQQYLRPNERRLVGAPAEEAVVLRAVGAPGKARLLPDGGAATVTASFDGARWRAEASTFTPGELALELRNETAKPVVAVIEREVWDPDAASAGEVMLLQEFRDLFGSEVLAPGQSVAVRCVALLFTDLGGSTARYEEIGDAPAYGQVNRHFDYVARHATAAGGTVVKTIGDAVMAAFPGLEEALEAALRIQAGLARWCREQGIEPPLALKVGLHEGPAIAVTANDRLDYFGRTVNVAARVASAAAPGDVVLLAEVAGDRLPEDGVTVAPDVRRLRGLAGEQRLVRLRVAAAAPAAPA